MQDLSRQEFEDWALLYSEFRNQEVDTSERAMACLTLDGKWYTRGKLLRLLGSGSSAWNRWLGGLPSFRWLRRSRWQKKMSRVPGYLIDLRSADLRRLDLSNCYFGNVNFTGSRFTQAKLRGANFSDWPGVTIISSATLDNCDFRSADLAGVHLSGVSLKGADLSRAEFNGGWSYNVDFSGENLFRTMIYYQFRDSNFQDADFKEADLFETEFIDTDLGKAKNLDKCNFSGPCVLDHRTIFKSGKLPDSFYRGCGFPDRLIEYLPSLIGQPIQLYSCFISFSAKDMEFVERLHADLQSKGIRCWYAPDNLKIGARVRIGLDEGVRHHDKLLVVISKNSLNSQWVEQEVETALERERQTGSTVIFPIRIDGSVMRCKSGWGNYIKNTRNIGDFTKWKDHDVYQKAFQRLLRDLHIENT